MVDESNAKSPLTWEDALSILDANFDFRMPAEIGEGMSYRLAPNGRSLVARNSSLGVTLDLLMQVPGLKEELPNPGMSVHRYIIRGLDDLELATKEFRLAEIGLGPHFLPVPVPLPPIPDGVEAISPMRSDVNQYVACAMFGRNDGATLTELQESCAKYSREYFENNKPMPRQTASLTKSKLGHHWQWTSSKTNCELAKTGKFRGGEPVFKLMNYKSESAPHSVDQRDSSVKVNMKIPSNPVLEATNTILYGPPGTGKTYATAERAVMLCDGNVPDTRKELMARYEELRAEQRISFVTFHQSFGYEEFVEGLRPEVKDGQVTYSVRPGIFREVCAAAKRSQLVKPGLSGKPLAERKVFKMSLGVAGSPEGKLVFQDAVSKGIVLLGWGENVDFSECVGQNAMKTKLDEVGGFEKTDTQARYVAVFKDELELGDIIIVSQGNTAFKAIGEVVGDYEFLESPLGGDYHQSRAVRWIAVFEGNRSVDEIYSKNFMQSSLYKLQPEYLKLDALEALIKAQSQSGRQDFVLVIDEINRANISKVFGELITLLEPDKREGEVNALTLKLPYSGTEFSVPANLHVIGTMNTSDRSIALLDTALRRRFDFEELAPDPSTLRGNVVGGVDLEKLLTALNERIESLFDRDHRIGHAFFIGVTSLVGLEQVFRRKVIPLLQEYFYENWSNVRRVLNDYGSGDFVVRTNLAQLPADGEESFSDEPRVVYRVNAADFPVTAYQRIYGGN